VKYRRLGKTGLKVSVVGIGTYQYGGEWGKVFTEDDVLKIFRAAEDTGINLVDTAECYGDHLAERLVGTAIKGKRDRWVVATKFGHEFHGFQKRTRNFTASGMREQLEASLRALQTDYVDVYQIHSPLDTEFDDDMPWEMLNAQVKAGKIRFLGLSLSRQTSQESLEHQVKRALEYGVSVIQLMYNRLSRTPEEKILPFCQKNDLGVFARVPLASGVLTGKYAPGTTFPKNDLRSLRDQKLLQQQLRDAAEIKEPEVPAGTDMTAWALAWCLRHQAVSCIIPGCKNPKQVGVNASASELPDVSDNHRQAWVD